MPLVMGIDVCSVVGGILMMMHRWIIVCILAPIIIGVIHIVRVGKVMARVGIGLMRRASWFSRCSRDGSGCLCRNLSRVGSG